MPIRQPPRRRLPAPRLVTVMARRYAPAGAGTRQERQWVYSTYSTACRTARAARATRARKTRTRRDVADDHGDPGAARLQGGQAYRRQPAECGTGANPRAIAQHRECRHGRRSWRRPWRSSQGRPRRPARRRCGGQRDLAAGSATCSSNSSRTATATPPIRGSARVRTSRSRRAISPTRSAPTRSTLASQSGLSRDELLSGLSQYLPGVIDHLTPEGRLPTENEVSGRI